MFHVFALVYLTTGFLWPTLLFFPCFASHERARVYCVASVFCKARVYAVSLRMCGASTLAFNFLKIISRYAKRSGTLNVFLFPVV